ncbi:MAG TPA: hypothetical protein VKU62_10095 [Thermoanaerobaculia bacterium]|nr:hypothetical protein [Thermoanaerobaculia bacterium]
MKRLAIALLLIAIPALAQNAAPQFAESTQTRDALRAVLRAYPPTVGRVLHLDPTLMSNESYLATYPGLAAFLKEHPEVQHNPAFFFEVYGQDDSPGSYRLWRELVGDLGGFFAFLVVTGVVVWIIKTVVDQRRWNRLAAIQTDVHSRLLDRFTTNDEMLAYLQTPAGKKFLEAAPIPVDAGPRPMSAPVGRIFWSIQLGLVLIAAGIGFDVVSIRATGDAANGLYGVGVIALLVGIALALSAGIFYLLSRRFGLWPQSVS